MPTNQEILGMMEVLDAQFTILNIEGLRSGCDIYFYWDEDIEETDCPDCGGWGIETCDLGHDHECSHCDGTGKIEITGNQREKKEVYFYSNIII